jgi:undecaprenyl-diphosphatase
MKAITAHPQSKAQTHLFSDLRTPGWLAKWPLIGISMFILGSLLFGAFAYNLQTNGPLVQQDVSVANNLHTIALSSPKIVLAIMIFGSLLGREIFALIGIILGIYFIYKRYWAMLAMVILGFEGGSVLFYLVSHYFNRHRPVFARPVWQVIPFPSFPSGHTISAVVCYGLLAYMLVPRMPTRFWKAVVVVVALLIIVYIGYSRVFVGDHYLSDVLAGYAMGIAWAGLVYTIIEIIAKRKAAVRKASAG